MVVKMKKLNVTIICLTIITLAEVFIGGQVSGSGVLWIGYGIYKMITWQ